MGSEGPGKYDKVRLIPWDAADVKQYQRMYDQRIACGWRHEEVPEWKDKVLAGTKFLYWVVRTSPPPPPPPPLPSSQTRSQPCLNQA